MVCERWLQGTEGPGPCAEDGLASGARGRGEQALGANGPRPRLPPPGLQLLFRRLRFRRGFQEKDKRRGEGEAQAEPSRRLRDPHTERWHVPNGS